MKRWLELQSAFYVAKYGNVSKASEQLNVHRATIIRHIDKLEDELSEKLFLRHAKGYETTDLGKEMLKQANAAQAHFDHLAGAARLKEGVLSGELIVTSLDINCVELLPVIQRFQALYPNIVLSYIVSDKIAKLEYGEAHVAIRTGRPVADLDCVVRPFMKYAFALYGHKDYVAKMGKPDSIDDLHKYHFVTSSLDMDPSPFSQWLKKEINPQKIAFVSNEHRVVARAVEAGFGLGFLPVNRATKNPNLIEVLPAKEEWSVNCCIVTHGDIYRSPKIKEFIRFFKCPENFTDDFSEVCIYNQ